MAGCDWIADAPRAWSAGCTSKAHCFMSCAHAFCGVWRGVLRGPRWLYLHWHDDGLWVAVRHSTSGICGGCTSLVRAGFRRPLRAGDDATDVLLSRVLAVRSVMRFVLVVFAFGHVTP